MDLRQLQFFVTLAEARNFHRAARQLNISQPPLSVAIRKLEDELGARLFVRGARGVTLTDAGEAALGPARSALVQAANVRTAAREGMAGNRGRLSIGFVGSAIYSLIPRLIPQFRDCYPGVELVLEESTSVDIARRLRVGDLDIGLVRLPLLEAGGLTVHSIEIDELVVAAPKGRLLSRGSAIALATLASEPFILHTRISLLHALTVMACHAAGFTPRVAQEATQVHTILSLVQSGLGCALVPSKAAQQPPPGVELFRLEERVPIEAGVAISSNNFRPAARNFEQLARSVTDS